MIIGDKYRGVFLATGLIAKLDDEHTITLSDFYIGFNNYGLY